MDVQTLDPGAPDDLARWAAQLAVSQDELRAAIAAVGTDLDKVQAHLLARRLSPPPAD